MDNTKFCKYCGQQIAGDAVICTHCGRQVEQLQQSQAAPNIVINNANNNTNTNTNTVNAAGTGPRARNKWAAFFLCLFFGVLGAHKFYEKKTLLGVVYLFTVGIFGIGWAIDCLILLFKPNPYYV